EREQRVRSTNASLRVLTTLRAPAGLDERWQTCRSTTAPRFLLLATKSRSDGAASLGVMNSVNLVKLCSGRKRKMASRKEIDAAGLQPVITLTGTCSSYASLMEGGRVRAGRDREQ